MKKKYIIISLLILLLILFDQGIKLLVLKNIVNSPVIIIDNFLKFIYVKNTGAAFGFLGNSTNLLVILTVILLYYLINEIRRNIDSKLSIVSLSLIVSGAIGNLIDRVFRGYVIDYISFTIFNREMAVFNAADIFITFGVILLMYIILMDGRSERISSRRKR